ncbi:hypothetical protein ACF0H5_020931 [Mactra antiquata]
MSILFSLEFHGISESYVREVRYTNLVEAQIPPNQQLKCRICNRATALSDCQTQAVCDNTKEKCYMDEIITDQLTVVFTGGCRSKYVCDQVTAVGKRQDLTACTKCCDSDDCNKVLCGIKNDLINNSQCYFCEGRDQSNPQSDVINPKDCVTMTTCQSDEVCYTGEEGFGGDSSHFHYGCHNKRTCLTLMNVAYKDYHICETNTTQPPGGVTWYEYCGDQRYHKRSRYVCHSCCNYPSCNYGSCHEQNVRLFMLADQGKFDLTTLKLTV